MRLIKLSLFLMTGFMALSAGRFFPVSTVAGQSGVVPPRLPA